MKSFLTDWLIIKEYLLNSKIERSIIERFVNSNLEFLQTFRVIFFEIVFFNL